MTDRYPSSTVSPWASRWVLIVTSQYTLVLSQKEKRTNFGHRRRSGSTEVLDNFVCTCKCVTFSERRNENVTLTSHGNEKEEPHLLDTLSAKIHSQTSKLHCKDLTQKGFTVSIQPEQWIFCSWSRSCDGLQYVTLVYLLSQKKLSITTFFK